MHVPYVSKRESKDEGRHNTRPSSGHVILTEARLITLRIVTSLVEAIGLVIRLER